MNREIIFPNLVNSLLNNTTRKDQDFVAFNVFLYSLIALTQ